MLARDERRRVRDEEEKGFITSTPEDTEANLFFVIKKLGLGSLRRERLKCNFRQQLIKCDKSFCGFGRRRGRFKNDE
jgi:hypothetical protein